MGNEEKYRATAFELMDLADRASDPELSAIYASLSFAYQRLAVWVGNREQDDPEQIYALPDAIRQMPERASPLTDTR